MTKPLAVAAHVFAGGFAVGMRRHFDVPVHLEVSNYGVATARRMPASAAASIRLCATLFPAPT